MKNVLLLPLGILFSTAVIAQKPENPEKSPTETLVVMGSATNVFTMLKSLQNQVDYNPDLNMISFVHRQNTELTPDGGSGSIRFDYSTDTGVNWNINQGPLSVDLVAADGLLTVPTTVGEEVVFGLRYPNGAIFNPVGNTDLANAFYVTASAAAVQDEGFIGHIGVSCFTSTKMSDLSTPSEQYLQVVSDDTWSGDYHLFGLVQGGDAMWAASSLFFEDGNIENYSKIAIWKGMLNNNQNDFIWSATVIEPDFSDYTTEEGQVLMTSDNRSVAFSPDGSVGYLVVLGSLIEYDDNLSRPIVYKTADAGENWILQPELDITNMQVADLVEYTEGATTIKRPVVWSMDVVVDINGTLHVISEMNRGTPVDGEAFTWLDDETGINNTFYVDFSLSSSGNWSSRYIGEPVNITEGILDNFWSSFYVVEHNLQASRTADGGKVFFSWLASPLSNDDSNNEPDIIARGLDVVNNTWTDVKTLTFDSDIESIVNIASLAPTCITNGDDFDYELPFVTIEDFVLGSVEETDFIFVKGLGFNEIEFIPLGINEHPISQIEMKVWPIPANESINLSYNLKQASAVSVGIFNALGKKVNQSALTNKSAGWHGNKIGISNLESGIYFIKLLVEDKTYTRKIVVQD